MIYSSKSLKDDVEEFLDIEANNGDIEDSMSIQESNVLDTKPVVTGNELSSLCYQAFHKYGPSFLSAVKSVIPFVAAAINPENEVISEEYLNYVLHSVIELGYTRKELEIMNDPILEFVSTLPPNTQGFEISEFNSRINSALDYFYKEISEEKYAPKFAKAL